MRLSLRSAIPATFAVLLAFLVGSPVLAACTGDDLIANMPADDRAAILMRAEAAPFSNGNFWVARKRGMQVTLAGTYHIDDPRFDGIVARLAPALKASKTLLVEAGPKEIASLQEKLGKNPGLIVSPSGESLYQELPSEDWNILSTEMAKLGLPGPMVMRLQPWYVMILLGMAGCNGTIDPAGGLDMRLIRAAEAEGLPVMAVEPSDTILTLFSGVSRAEQVALLKSAIAEVDPTGNAVATVTEAYFRGEARLIWEFTAWQAARRPGVSPEDLAQELALMEEVMITRRNRAWLPVIETAAEGGPVFVAVGALHLPGEAGVLNLLARSGWQITPLSP